MISPCFCSPLLSCGADSILVELLQGIKASQERNNALTEELIRTTGEISGVDSGLGSPIVYAVPVGQVGDSLSAATLSIVGAETSALSGTGPMFEPSSPSGQARASTGTNHNPNVRNTGTYYANLWARKLGPANPYHLVRSRVDSYRIALRQREGSEDILVLDTRSADIIKALYLCFSIQCACNIEQFLQLSPQSQVGNWIHLANTLTPL